MLELHRRIESRLLYPLVELPGACADRGSSGQHVCSSLPKVTSKKYVCLQSLSGRMRLDLI